MQIKYVRTIVGWVNVYDMKTGKVINMNPEQFAALCPNVSRKSRLGCLEISVAKASKLFVA